MSKDVEQRLEKRRQELIEKLLSKGIFKVSGHQLYHLTLRELEMEYNQVSKEA
ncbi:Fur-regulated basic protein FbpA [Alteribacter aurantiacus]|uniref:Fur-regulated basic protein FbpA n=1 Tax=Alteribacter aurantiacus TaxID=254410 RepID=UPI0003FDC92F|nr:Fur-regulated basic protein FbpA [Alteribacter aurantiacus]